MSTAFGLIQLFLFLPVIATIVLIIYALILSIMALRVYIRKNR